MVESHAHCLTHLRPFPMSSATSGSLPRENAVVSPTTSYTTHSHCRPPRPSSQVLSRESPLAGAPVRGGTHRFQESLSQTLSGGHDVSILGTLHGLVALAGSGDSGRGQIPKPPARTARTISWRAAFGIKDGTDYESRRPESRRLLQMSAPIQGG